jgi:retron-type reverse transcriptase
MHVSELEEHLRRHWPKIRAKLLSGAYVPLPVKRVEIPKPNPGPGALPSQRVAFLNEAGESGISTGGG